MVKKLLKYEFISYLRTLVPMYIIMLAVGLVTRFIQLFENDHFTYNIVFGSSVLALVVSILVCLVMTAIVSIVRFYKNLYSSEGYLSFTLPVTSGQHIFTKLVMSITFTLIGVVVAFVSGAIATMGEVFVEVMKAAFYILKMAYKIAGTNVTFYIIEIVLMLLVALICGYLLYYGCITIGQTAKKNRIFKAFLAYFIYYLISQVIGTVFGIIGMFFGEMGVVGRITSIIEQNPIPSLHVIFVSCIAVYALLSVIYYFVIRYIMNRKLNLE